jgi:hypothetical protein
MLAFLSCKKEVETENPAVNTVTYATKNYFLYKTLLIGRAGSVTYDSSTGTSIYRPDSLPVTNEYYVRLTSKINTGNSFEIPDYVTQFYFDSTTAMHYDYYSWYEFAGMSTGSIYGQTSEGWELTYYHINSDTNNSYTLAYYFKEFNNVIMPLPPLK